MKYVLWLLKAAIFFTLFAFALNNQHLVTVHWFFGAFSQAPLVLVVLLAFGLGLVLGVAVMLPRWWRIAGGERQRYSRPVDTDTDVQQMPAAHEL